MRSFLPLRFTSSKDQRRFGAGDGACCSPVGRASLVLIAALLGIGGVGIVVDSVPAFAKGDKKEKESEEVDYLSLAARLIADDKLDRAGQMLDQVDPAQEGVDLKKYHTLRGLVQLKQGATKDAIANFEAAISAGQEDPAIHLYLAQAHFAAKSYEKAILSLDKAGAAAKTTPAAFGMRAQAHWELKQPGRAFSALDGGIAAFPEDSSLLRTKIFYLVELGLFQEVVSLSGAYLERPHIDESEYIAISEALRRGKQLEKARAILGQAKLKYPESTQVAVQMAHTYVDEGKPLLGAMLFEDAARLDQKYALEAAELYKQAGRTQLALALNERVLEQKEKLKQRLSLLLEAERFEMIPAMAPALSRNGLLVDDNVRYALAYAYFKLGDFAEAESQLRPIKDPDLFRAATQLRKAMSNCREAGWECF